MGILSALFTRVNTAESNVERDNRARQSAYPRSDEQKARKRTWGFPAILDYVDMHQRDGQPSSPSGAFGSKYQLVQMLSLRNPDDARWLQDSHPTPSWLRTSPVVWENQRNALAPGAASSPYVVESWHAATYRGVPNVGAGPGTTLVVPIANANQRGVND